MSHGVRGEQAKRVKGEPSTFTLATCGRRFPNGEEIISYELKLTDFALLGIGECTNALFPEVFENEHPG